MNSIILIWRMGADTEMRQTANGVNCANCRIAVQR